MLDKYLPAIGVIGLGLLLVGYFTISIPQEAARKDALTFSNTHTWDPEELAVLHRSTLYPAAMYGTISLPPPPKNSSPTTAAELKLLASYRALRSADEIRDIYAELNLEDSYFAGKPLKVFMDKHQFPAVALLLRDAFYDLGGIEMRQKEKFNRIRPSLLDSSLDTVIAVPDFPAYPSYHSSEAYFIAHVFSELAPERKDEFMARAYQIALNREIAGVHYPSDSAAGKLLAQQFFDILMKNDKFKTFLATAKIEWSKHPELL
jgi:hypothetical protein